MGESQRMLTSNRETKERGRRELASGSRGKRLRKCRWIEGVALTKIEGRRRSELKKPWLHLQKKTD